MPLGRKVGLGPGHIVLDGDLAPNGKGHSTPPAFRSIYCGQTPKGHPSQQLLSFCSDSFDKLRKSKKLFILFGSANILAFVIS